MSLIIHHWDTDGIASAALIASIVERRGKEWENITPHIGIYSFSSDILEAADGLDEVYVVDLNVPTEELLKLAKVCRRVIFIDHHSNQRPIVSRKILYINPITFGSTEREFPSTTWVISDIYSEWGYLSALGALGDLGVNKLRKYCMEPQVRELLKCAMLSIEDARALVRLLDSFSIVRDRIGVMSVVKDLLRENPKKLLHNKRLNKNLKAIENEIRRVMKNVTEDGGIAVVTFNSNYDVVSKVARALVWDHGYKAAIVANLKEINGAYKVYLRLNPETAGEIDIGKILDEIRRKGIQCGGKVDVLGVNARSYDEALQVVNLIRRLLK